MIWPTEIQNQAQAMFDAKEELGRAEYECFLPTDANGEPVNFCGECGKVGPTNSDNDVCAECEQKLAEKVKP